MGAERKRIVINRLMQLILVLHESKTGLTVKQLIAKLEYTKSTIHRDLETLREIGIVPDVRVVTGEPRYSLPKLPFAAIAPTPMQFAAVCLAREALSNFDGTQVVQQIDDLLAQWGRFPKAQLQLAFHRRGSGRSAIIGTLDGAITKKRRVALEYQGERDPQPKQRKVEPIALRAAGEQLYLFAYDVEQKAYRTFKAARMQKAWVLSDEPANDHSRVDLEAKFANAVKAWTADNPTSVVVRISSEKARFVKEYPLVPNQRLVELEDGAVEITAEVNGILEVVGWVLSWGAHAEAVSPEELRERIAEEVRGAAKRYDAIAGMRKTKARRDEPRDEKRVANQSVSRELGRRGRRVAE